MILITAIGCKDSTKKLKIRLRKLKLQKEHTVVNDSAKVSFTAYKTTDKAAVRGVFKRDNIDEYQTRRNSFRCFEWCSIQYSSSGLFTNDLLAVEILRF
jgi:hypothetical protein